MFGTGKLAEQAGLVKSVGRLEQDWSKLLWEWLSLIIVSVGAGGISQDSFGSEWVWLVVAIGVGGTCYPFVLRNGIKKKKDSFSHLEFQACNKLYHNNERV